MFHVSAGRDDDCGEVWRRSHRKESVHGRSRRPAGSEQSQPGQPGWK